MLQLTNKLKTVRPVQTQLNSVKLAGKVSKKPDQWYLFYRRVFVICVGFGDLRQMEGSRGVHQQKILVGLNIPAAGDVVTDVARRRVGR